MNVQQGQELIVDSGSRRATLAGNPVGIDGLRPGRTYIVYILPTGSGGAGANARQSAQDLARQDDRPTGGLNSGTYRLVPEEREVGGNR